MSVWKFWRKRQSARRAKRVFLRIEGLEERALLSNQPPVAINDSYVVNENNILNVTIDNSILLNDVEFQPLLLTPILVSSTQHGALTLNTDGTFAYVPNQNFFGADTFTYKDNDGTQDSNIATVTINVHQVTLPPSPFQDTYTAQVDRPLLVPAPGVLANDVDPQGAKLTARLVNPTHNGSLTFSSDGSFTYVPNAGYQGPDTFIYVANNGTFDSAPTTVYLTVLPPGGTLTNPTRQPFQRVGLFAVGGSPGLVQVRRAGDGAILGTFAPYGSSYTGGVTVAVGDVNGDGQGDIVVGATVGNMPVKVYDGSAFASGAFTPSVPDASLLTQFFPYGTSTNFGVNVAVGDVENSGFADIVTGAMAGNPDVRIFKGKDIAAGTFNPTGGSMLTQFFAYGLQFNVGANVAVGDINHDGYADVVTGATAGNPDVHIYDGKALSGKGGPSGVLIAQFFAYGLNFNVGVSVAVGDINGDGFADVITGATIGNPHVKVFDGKSIISGPVAPPTPDSYVIDSFFAYALQFNVGVHVAAANIGGDGKVDILTGASTGSPHFRVVAGSSSGILPPALGGLEGVLSGFQGGIYVGA